MKKIIAALVCVLTVLSLFGCSSADYKQGKAEFSKGGITLTLTKAFGETELSGVSSAHATYASEVAKVAVFKEIRGTTLLTSAREYAEKWIISNVKFNPEKLKEENGVISTVYKAAYEEKSHSFYTAFYASEDAFWIVQYFCPTDRFDEYSPYFARWAKNVKFQNS